MYIYVASSWRNQFQQEMVSDLRKNGFEVYDFKNPEPGNHGFQWSQIDPEWQKWTSKDYIFNLEHPIARSGYGKDYEAMLRSDACVLVLPCGRSAHLEAGWFVGAGKPTFIWMPEPMEPELMYKMVSGIYTSKVEIIDALMVENEISLS